MVKILSSTQPIERGAENRFIGVVLFISLCALCSLSISCMQTKDLAQSSPVETRPGATDPPPVTQIDDAKIKQLLKPNGRPLLVNFWATWCGPCREEFPDLVKIDADYRGRIDFITISLDFVEELNTGVPKFLGEMNAEMPTYLLVSADENKFVSSISKDWSGALPFTILYNEQGEINYLRQGKVNRQALQGEIEKTFAE